MVTSHNFRQTLEIKSQSTTKLYRRSTLGFPFFQSGKLPKSSCLQLSKALARILVICSAFFRPAQPVCPGKPYRTCHAQQSGGLLGPTRDLISLKSACSTQRSFSSTCQVTIFGLMGCGQLGSRPERTVNSDTFSSLNKTKQKANQSPSKHVY